MAFGMVPRHVEGKLTAMELAVYVALSWYANEHGQCWPSHRKLGLSAGCKETAVKTALNGLRGKHLLTWENRVSDETGGPTSNIYTLNVWLPLGAKRPGGRRETPRGGSLNDDKQDQGTTPEEQPFTPPPTASSADEVLEAELVDEEQPTAQTLLGEWIDSRGPNDPPNSQVKGQVARILKRLLEDGVPYHKVRLGFANWAHSGYGAGVLASYVDNAGKTPQRNGHQQETDDKFARAMARAEAGRNAFATTAKELTA